MFVLIIIRHSGFAETFCGSLPQKNSPSKTSTIAVHGVCVK